MNKYHSIVNDHKILIMEKEECVFNIENLNEDYVVSDFTSQVNNVSVKGKDYKCLLVKKTDDEIIFLIEGNYYKCSVCSDLEYMINNISNGEGKVQNKSIISPMPGLLSKVFVKIGEAVQIGDPIFELEAMKMKNIVKADIEGVIQKINFKTGETVEKGSIIISFDE